MVSPSDASPPDELLSSADAAHLLGVSTTSVKRWADEGLLPCVKTAGKHRRFSRAMVEQWKGVLAGLPSDPPVEPRAIVPWVDALLHETTPHGIEARLLTARAELGSWAAVGDLLGPVLRELGERWVRGELTIIEEHIASERLQRGISRICEWLPSSPTAPRALLAVADGDEHTLGLSLVELALRELGWTTLFAGRRTPTAELLEMIATHGQGISLVALSASATSIDRVALAAQAETLGEACALHEVRLLLGGSGAWPEAPRHGARLHRLVDLRAAL